MSLSAFILAVAGLHFAIVGIIMAFKYAVDQRNQSIYQLRLDVPDPPDVFIGYPNYSVDEGSPTGEAIGSE